jgi:hypothetical protein
MDYVVLTCTWAPNKPRSLTIGLRVCPAGAFYREFTYRKAAKSETSSRNDRLLEEPTYLDSNNVFPSKWFH